MAAIFRNVNSHMKGMEKPMDRENLPPAFESTKLIGKENILSERRHTGRKQAFGELKNVLHNTGAPTPMKSMKSKIISPNTPMKTKKEPLKPKKTPLTTKQSAKRHDRIRKVPNADSVPKPNRDYDDGLFVWSQQSAAVAERAMNRLRSGGDDDDLLLPLPDISSMETFESVFGKIEPIALNHFENIPEPQLPSVPSIEWDDMLFDF